MRTSGIRVIIFMRKFIKGFYFYFNYLRLELIFNYQVFLLFTNLSTQQNRITWHYFREL